ncbi:uncharacterized protein LOC144864548 [Branchiostoma floridae x Branchiostoma japonicum]
MTGSIAYKEVVEFSCDTGYYLVGAESILCRVDGTWSGTVPTCALVHCPALPAPSDGTVTEGNAYQTVLQFACDSGYYLVGENSLTCQADGTWTNSAPTCAAVECQELTAPVNGEMTGTNFYPAKVHFTCDSGYVLDGSPTLSCQADATWSETVPSCRLVQCPALTAPANGDMVGSNFYGDEVQFSCMEGYEIFGTSTITCLEDGQWSRSAPICTAGRCPNLVPPMNGGMSGDNLHSHAVTFFCNSGYVVQGSESVSCQLDSTWTGSPPTCTVKHCPALTSPANGGKIGSNYYRDEVTFFCVPGYDLVGESSVTCMGDGRWSESVPQCSAIHCPSLTSIDHGTVIGSNAYRSVVTFNCLPGYELQGDTDSLTCQADRTWSGPVPACVEVKCPAQAAPSNGAKIGGNSYNDVVNFMCVSGYHLVGSSSATCQGDGTWTAPTPTCPDVDECATSNGGCEHICTNTDGSFHCSCDVGYSLSINSLSCNDIDECASANGGCGHRCTNSIGTFQCLCNSGYVLNADNLGCDDVDECASDNGGCEQTCRNSAGSYQCSCNTGYALNGDGHLCDDINECSIENGGCNQTCVNEVGSFYCQCGDGFLLNSDGFACDDIDECSTDNGECSQTCTNAVGSYDCSCWTGFALNSNLHTCRDVNECDRNNGGCNQNCVNIIGSYRCDCDVGYLLNADGAGCDDVDDCNATNGGCDHNCTNTIGSFYCSCGDGYSLSNDGSACDDVDECADANGGCQQICTNLISSFSCSCNRGYYLDFNGADCHDINECWMENNGCEQICHNSRGSFSCACTAGYLENPNGFSCDDIDECSSENGGCDHTCINTAGSYRCSCADGYALTSDGHSCTDVDECIESWGICGHDAVCNNSIGFFECTCNHGFTMMPGGCRDIDECAASEYPCDQNAFCYNTMGSFACICGEGFIGSGKACKEVCTTTTPKTTTSLKTTTHTLKEETTFPIFPITSTESSAVQSTSHWIKHTTTEEDVFQEIVDNGPTTKHEGFKLGGLGSTNTPKTTLSSTTASTTAEETVETTTADLDKSKDALRRMSALVRDGVTPGDLMGYLSAQREQENCDVAETSQCEKMKIPKALEMVYNLSSVIEDAEQVEVLATATDLLLKSSNRLDLDEQVTGGYIVEKLTKCLRTFSEKGVRFRDLSPAATAIVDTVSTLVDDDVQGMEVPKDESHLLPPRKRKTYKEKLEKERLEKQGEQWKLKKESVSTLMGQVDNIANALMSSTEVPESPSTIGTKTMQLVLDKESKSKLGEETLSLPAGKVDFPTDDALLPFTSSSSSDVGWKITGFNDNPYIWDRSAGDIKSSVVDVTLGDANGNEIPVNGLSEAITIVLQNRPEMFRVGHLVNYKHYDNDTMAFRDFQAMENATYGVTLTVRTAGFIREAKVYGKLGGDPNDTVHDFRTVLSWEDFDITGYEGNETFTAFIVLPVEKVNNGSGQYTLGLLIEECLSQKCKYSADIVRIGCRYWDTEDNAWKGDGCKVSSKTSRKETVCLCDHLTAFAADIVRVPTRDPSYSRSRQVVLHDDSMVCLEE